METVQYKNYTIPEGHYICVSPALAQLDEQVWGADAKEFNPDRFLDDRAETSEAMGHGANSCYLPFGAGRHRCIGEAFAYVQLKTIIATIVQTFDWEFPTGRSFPAADFTTLIVMPVKPVDVAWARRQAGKMGVDATMNAREE
jgi:cytochrome P450